MTPRLVLGLSANEWAVGAFVLVVCLALGVACYQDVKGLLGSLFADNKKTPEPYDHRRFTRPSYREAQKARRGVWR